MVLFSWIQHPEIFIISSQINFVVSSFSRNFTYTLLFVIILFLVIE